MPRRITGAFTFDDCEEEIFFTRAALKADLDAADLLSTTDGWLELVDAARAKDRIAREAFAEASAARSVANGRLDDACRAFGDELHLAVRRDHSAARYRRFFPSTVGAFVRQRLVTQVAAVRSWLTTAGDELLDRHHEALDRWSNSAQSALDATQASAQTRGLAIIAREALADDLTRERDGLEAALMARARERDLTRDWPSRFFRVESRASTTTDAPAPQPIPSLAP